MTPDSALREDAGSEQVAPPSLELSLRWLEEFKRDHGRPLRVLHFGNIANNAYLNAKFLRAVGVDAHVMSSDYYHIMATPEWEEIEVTRPYGTADSPYFDLADLGTYFRPDWFLQGTPQECLQQVTSKVTRELLLPVPEMPPAEVLLSPKELLQLQLMARYMEPFSRELRHKIDQITARIDMANSQFDSQFNYINGQSAYLLTYIGAMSSQATWVANKVDETFGQLNVTANQVNVTDNQVKSTANQVDAIATQLIAIAKDVAAIGARVEHVHRYGPRFFLWRWIDKGVVGAAGNRWVRMVYRRLRYGEPLRGRPGSGDFTTIDPGFCEPAKAIMTPADPPDDVANPADTGPQSLDSYQTDIATKAEEPPDAVGISVAVGVDGGQNDEISRTIADFASAFPNRSDQLTHDDLVAFVAGAPVYRQVFEHYDLIQCYGTHPIWGYLAGNRPYVAFEHGTLRTFTLGDNALCRLTALGYRRADHTFITNGDCLAYAAALGITGFSAMIHPVDVELHRRDLGEAVSVKRRFNADVLLFCPLRHDWEVKGTDVHLRALPLLRACLPGRIVLALINWGQQVDDSRNLIAQNDCEDCVVWLPPLSRITMARAIRSADVVLDQIALPHFGATAPQALAAGTPVISSYKPESTDWIVDEPAPILPAFSPVEVRDAVLKALDPGWRAQFSERAQRWINAYHHPDRLVLDHLHVYQRILTRDHGHRR